MTGGHLTPPGVRTGGLSLAGIIVIGFGGLAVLGGCGSRPPAAPATPDAAVASEAVLPPASMLLPASSSIAPAPPVAAPRPRLQLSLRSTPAGASVLVDGRPVGSTPARCEMDDDARLHDFAFVLRGYAPWRLRFAPSHDGVVHATLEAIREPDAGVR